ncbi:MAG: hypothetical protein M3024_01690 [Candidatus Dormibacteraeota bacterium]|nr:hypothetical protein [Candidatus Dormibacteraeota bacterium]
MSLDSLAFRQRQVELFERYGRLLTEHQRSVLELYLGRDWSLSEVARERSTSRSAVHDLVRRSSQLLEDYEERLGLLAESERRRSERLELGRELGVIRRRLAKVETEMQRSGV